MSDDKESAFPTATSDEILLSMFSDALGFEVTADTVLTPEQALTGGAIVQSRLDSVTEEMGKMRRGEPVDIDKWADTKAQAALLEMSVEQRDQL